jgi:hypothetical protein
VLHSVRAVLVSINVSRRRRVFLGTASLAGGALAYPFRGLVEATQIAVALNRPAGTPAEVFETRGRNVTLKNLGVAVRFIRPDVALAHVTNELSGLLSPEGQTLPSHQELSVCRSDLLDTCEQ